MSKDKVINHCSVCMVVIDDGLANCDRCNGILEDPLYQVLAGTNYKLSIIIDKLIDDNRYTIKLNHSLQEELNKLRGVK